MGYLQLAETLSHALWTQDWKAVEAILADDFQSTTWGSKKPPKSKGEYVESWRKIHASAEGGSLKGEIVDCVESDRRVVVALRTHITSAEGTSVEAHSVAFYDFADSARGEPQVQRIQALTDTLPWLVYGKKLGYSRKGLDSHRFAFDIEDAWTALNDEVPGPSGAEDVGTEQAEKAEPEQEEEMQRPSGLRALFSRKEPVLAK